MLRRNTRKGSYLVEASIVLPIFIIAVLMLVSIIPIITTIENISYIAADEMHLETVKSHFRLNPGAYPVALKHRVLRDNSKISKLSTNLYRYKFSNSGVDDLIASDFSADFQEKNPLGLFSKVTYNGKLLSRAYTGKYNYPNPSSREEFEKNDKSDIVYIFPNWGEKYHSKSCTYVKSNCQLTLLSQDIKRDYSPCHVCKPYDLKIGASVFCFINNGRVYHVGTCRVINKYYIEIEKDEAKKKGYKPCSKCGGG